LTDLPLQNTYIHSYLQQMFSAWPHHLHFEPVDMARVVCDDFIPNFFPGA
jgi:hypothetical protein